MDKVLILGLGNILWADEGFGVRCIEKLDENYSFADNVRLMDGGTQGLYLIQYIMECQKLLIFDAIDYGLECGEMKLIKNQEVPAYMGAKKMSLHQTGFQETLATAQMLEQYPQEILLIGVQPCILENYGESLSPLVKAQINPAIEKALEQLQVWGINFSKNIKQNTELAPKPTLLEHYEEKNNF